MAVLLVSFRLVVVVVVAANVSWTDLQVLVSSWTEVETIRGGRLLIALEVPVLHLTGRGSARASIPR